MTARPGNNGVEGFGCALLGTAGAVFLGTVVVGIWWVTRNPPAVTGDAPSVVVICLAVVLTVVCVAAALAALVLLVWWLTRKLTRKASDA